jgi:hypothetical protein
LKKPESIFDWFRLLLLPAPFRLKKQGPLSPGGDPYEQAQNPLPVYNEFRPQPEGEYLETSALGFHGTLEASHPPNL